MVLVAPRETLLLASVRNGGFCRLILTGNEVGVAWWHEVVGLQFMQDSLGSVEDLDWLRCVEGPPGPEGHAINVLTQLWKLSCYASATPRTCEAEVVNLSSRLMAKYDEPEACSVVVQVLSFVLWSCFPRNPVFIPWLEAKWLSVGR